MNTYVTVQPQEHSPGCAFKRLPEPGENVARGLDPDNCERCRNLLARLQDQQPEVTVDEAVQRG